MIFGLPPLRLGRRKRGAGGCSHYKVQSRLLNSGVSTHRVATALVQVKLVFQSGLNVLEAVNSARVSQQVTNHSWSFDPETKRGRFWDQRLLQRWKHICCWMFVKILSRINLFLSFGGQGKRKKGLDLEYFCAWLAKFPLKGSFWRSEDCTSGGAGLELWGARRVQGWELSCDT